MIWKDYKTQNTKMSILNNPFIDSVNTNKKLLFDMLLYLVTIDNEYKYKNEVPSTEYGEEDVIEEK